ncbi:SURF1 family protein [Pseudooceanicola sediminis]|uniref:SURF1-like protein n=1 Tax=Pseudooceanicola sediminis TaxID=2211117 RepID=A0A399J5M5_9RHOB|nr:SURF1 family protein [Pseudooceanicola sediminis]KAA2317197.1 SURF1 family protein [Puniceibacterium sp. HSS470]RII40788.1 SURF1 family protein [Pseudooceanicola sediminis]|tara:strand:- start:29432 stop:30175 length:744 start_codon:yes stop_codon:yes gene_type:complete
MSRPLRWPLLIIVTLVATLAITGFASLGTWQLRRLHWKIDLIERVDARVHAPAQPAPGPADWPAITRPRDEYRHVTLHGTFLNDDEVQVYTPSDFGPAYWVMTPLRRDDDSIVMVNRGVVPEAQRDPATRTAAPTGPQTVTGLLRLPEDQGWLFSQDNRPEDDAWYRRDIAAIAAAKGLGHVAPYFVDQEKTDSDTWPRGGQTVVSFRNAHLSYAITWFALALMVLAGYALFLRHELGRSRGGSGES